MTHHDTMRPFPPNNKKNHISRRKFTCLNCRKTIMSLRVVSRKMPWSLLKVRQGTNTKTLMPSETLIKISASIATRQNMGQPNWMCFQPFWTHMRIYPWLQRPTAHRNLSSWWDDIRWWCKIGSNNGREKKTIWLTYQIQVPKLEKKSVWGSQTLGSKGHLLSKWYHVYHVKGAAKSQSQEIYLKLNVFPFCDRLHYQ